MIQMTTAYELYRHERQKRQMTDDISISTIGHYLEAHLRESGLMDRSLSLESDLVKGWIAHPETYPEELKGIYPVLWGSAQDHLGVHGVSYLHWYNGSQVLVYWYWVGRSFDGHDPALLASTSTGT